MLQPPNIRLYGQYKYLTFHCLSWQLISAILHFIAHFIKPIRPVRDLVFTTISSPLSYLVVFTFWGVWHIRGREFIFPDAIATYIPDWLNHTTHSVPIPINIAFQMLCNHRFTRNSYIIILGYMLTYTVFLCYFKRMTGNFFYKYIDIMSGIEVFIYFSASGLLALICYKIGQYINSYLHPPVLRSE